MNTYDPGKDPGVLNAIDQAHRVGDMALASSLRDQVRRLRANGGPTKPTPEDTTLVVRVRKPRGDHPGLWHRWNDKAEQTVCGRRIPGVKAWLSSTAALELTGLCTACERHAEAGTVGTYRRTR